MLEHEWNEQPSAMDIEHHQALDSLRDLEHMQHLRELETQAQRERPDRPRSRDANSDYVESLERRVRHLEELYQQAAEHGGCCCDCHAEHGAREVRVGVATPRPRRTTTTTTTRVQFGSSSCAPRREVKGHAAPVANPLQPMTPCGPAPACENAAPCAPAPPAAPKRTDSPLTFAAPEELDPLEAEVHQLVAEMVAEVRELRGMVRELSVPEAPGQQPAAAASPASFRKR